MHIGCIICQRSCAFHINGGDLFRNVFTSVATAYAAIGEQNGCVPPGGQKVACYAKIRVYSTIGPNIQCNTPSLGILQSIHDCTFYFCHTHGQKCLLKVLAISLTSL